MKRLPHDRRVLLYAVMAALPAVLTALVLLWGEDVTPKVRWTFSVLMIVWWLAWAYALRERVVIPLQTVSNLLAAMREEDFSIRARGARPDDPLGEVMIEVNALSTMLREQRLGAMEATGLLRTIIEEIDLAIFTFDHEAKLRLVNRAGDRLLTRLVHVRLGSTAVELGLGGCLEGEYERTMELAFPGLRAAGAC